jgi:hypothetical protein
LLNELVIPKNTTVFLLNFQNYSIGYVYLSTNQCSGFGSDSHVQQVDFAKNSSSS